ncbi:hypothetical protein C483_06460 [Natrialba hulunbeirensis JCM 10989]|uniref:Uncharacterized protein n=1 Tax=Natrialba hulunbeirensis JCM 10989 TaxID=1227493 RepID=M0A4X1_9EURY|nr:hypothetical protein [Natrialba hulunbeirensis]ELY92952.1 hypothetical protein C483_06460 [Natrialba hulunbeirensis JCM 10989]
MSEYTSTNEPTTMAAESFAGRSPPMQTIVRDAVLPQAQSLPVSLCRAAAELTRVHRESGTGSGAHSGSDSGSDPNSSTEDTTSSRSPDLERILTPVETAVSYFEAYVRLRLDLLVTDRYPNTNPRARDAAILASDFLHAGAYAAVAEAPLSDRRALELYRLLTGASTRLSHQLLAVSQGQTVGRACTEGESGTESGSIRSTAATIASAASIGDDGVSRPNPLVTLSETAAELGAVAAGASDATRAELRSYSGSLTAGLVAAAVGVAGAGAGAGTGTGAGADAGVRTDADDGAGTATIAAGGTDADSPDGDADHGTESAGDATADEPSPVADAVAVLSSGWTASREQEQTLSPSDGSLTLSFTDPDATVPADVYRHYRLPSLSVDHGEGEPDKTHDREPDRRHSHEQRRDDALDAARAALAALDDGTGDAHSERDSVRTALEQATRVPVGNGGSAPIPSGAPGTDHTDDD